MKLVISVCHIDLTAALRQMAWIGFLSSKNGHSMLNESLLLVVSRRASKYPRFKQLAWLAARIFGEARCFVPDGEMEKGWPASANWSFKTGLEHVEQNFPDDILFLEPDGIPLCPDWYDQIQAEWLTARSMGKHFMGAFVPHSPSHMTGIAVYGREWRQFAPLLATTPDHDAFDTWSSPEVVPNCHFVPLIQHVFRRHDPGWEVPALGMVDKQAVLFHQDKKGKLVAMLDQAYHGYECRDHPLFGYSALTNDEKVMMKFYYAANVTRAIKSHGKRFLFDALDVHGGAIPGTYSTDIDAEQAALADLTSNPATGVTEISAEEWENCTKKKAPAQPSSNTFGTSSGPLPNAAILQTPSQSPAVLVAEPSRDGGKQAVPGNTAPIKDIADVIKTDTVTPAQSSHIGTKLPRPDQKKNFNINREAK